MTSLRGLQQASELANVQRKLGCQRAALGSLSEAAGVFDAELLKEIIAELGEELKPLARDARLKDIQSTITLVDGTLIAALPRVMEASWLKSKTGSGMVKWRLHTHFEVDRYVPTRIDVTPNGGGPHDERAVLERSIEADHLYVMDRGYAKFRLFNEIVSARSSYVCRLRDNSTYEVLETRELTPADIAAGVLSDQIVLFFQRQDRRAAQPSRAIGLHPGFASHQSRQVSRRVHGAGSDGILRIATNLLDRSGGDHRSDLSLSLVDRNLFRFFKHILGCRHLLSHDKNGIEIQTYCAIIACLLISLWTGRKPTLRTYEMICFYFCGMASEEELLAHIAKLQQHDA